MPARGTTLTFNTGTGSKTTTIELDPLDLSRAEWLKCYLAASLSLDTDSGDTFNVYLQSRGPDGTWEDRVAFTQLLGNQTPPELLYAVLLQATSLTAEEAEGEPSGSTGASRLTTGTTKNGPFPGLYRTSTGPGASWRVQIVQVDADNDAAFAGSIFIEWNTA